MSGHPRDPGGPRAVRGPLRGSLSSLAPIVAVALAGITLIAIIGLWVSARLTLRAVENDLADVEQEGVALTVALDDYDRIARLSDWVTTVGSDLDTAVAERVRWTSILDSVAATMPEGVGLITFDGSADTRQVSVTVESTTYTRLGDWLARTSSTSGLTDLTLISATRRPATGSQTEIVEAITRGHLAPASPRTEPTGTAADSDESAR